MSGASRHSEGAGRRAAAQKLSEAIDKIEQYLQADKGAGSLAQRGDPVTVCLLQTLNDVRPRQIRAIADSQREIQHLANVLRAELAADEQTDQQAAEGFGSPDQQRGRSL